jgi:hypothetical protein
MTILRSLAAIGLSWGFAAGAAHADILADWTFETTQPTTAGPFAPDIGSGAASGHHASTSTYSSPAGNGSAHSFSSNTWAVGDYYQFSTSTVGDSSISLAFDQTSSSTGPKDFELEYSTNGTTFTNISQYAVLSNGSPNAAWTASSNNPAYTFTNSLSSISALDNQANVYFRLVDLDTTSAGGGTVGTAGTDRVDNVVISGIAAPVPLPAGLWLFGSGLAGLAAAKRRRSGEPRVAAPGRA